MIWRIILILVIGYLAIVLLFFFRQRGIVFMPRQTLYYTPGDFGLPFREVILTTGDGVRLNAWFVGDISEEREPKPVILFCHGNAGNISHRCDTLAIFYQLGVDCFIFDYRGYGKSEGKPSEKGTYLDASTAYNYLTKTMGIPPEQIFLFGRSLGGAVATYLATLPGLRAKALILESTFTSVNDVGAELYPWLPVRMLSRFDYDTLKRLPHVHLPLLVVHSPQDEFIPYSHGKRLYEIANEPKHFLKLSGSHNEGYIQSREIYFAGLRDFLSTLPDESRN